MNFASWALWGLVATLAMTAASAATEGLRLTRMNLPYILGTMFTSDRDKARLYGFLTHAMVGWGFSILYALIFESLGAVSWWRGLLLGVAHGTVVLVVGFSLLPGLHPRMASEQHGPTATRILEPPGFLGANYGYRTVVSVLISHALFGVIFGAFYRL